MYIDWVHHYLPRIFGLLAIIVNPFFVFLVFKEKISTFGNYRYLLLYFATFNVIYSILYILVPIELKGYRYCFFVFLVDGAFYESSPFNHFMLTARCSLVGFSYAVLISHFIYRYLIIKGSDYTDKKFRRFMALSFALCLVYFAIWFATCEWLTPSDKVNDYIKDDFLDYYGDNSSNVNIIFIIYNEHSFENILASYSAILILVVFSTLSVAVYLVLGYKIMSMIREIALSASTQKMQIQLLKTLIVQTVIPIFISYLPCFLSWFSPAFCMDMGRTFNKFNVVTFSAFPFLDPIAIVICLPVLRNRFLSLFLSQKSVDIATTSNPITQVSSV